MTVEYEGELTEIDDMIYCGARIKGTLTRRPVRQVLPTRYEVTERLQDGSAVTISLSWKVCSFKQSQWRSHITPETEYKVPEGYTPAMNWRDRWDMSEATRVISFLGEEALYGDDALVRIVRPIEFSVPVHPPTKAIISDIFREDDVYIAQYKRARRMVNNPVIIRIPESEWRNVKKYSEVRQGNFGDNSPRRMDLALAHLSKKAAAQDGISYLYAVGEDSEDLRSAMNEYVFYHRPGGRSLEEDGLFRRQIPGLGVTGSTIPSLNRWGTYMFPLMCGEEDTVFPLPELQGAAMRLVPSQSCTIGARIGRKPLILEIAGARLDRVRKGVRNYVVRGPNRSLFVNKTGERVFFAEIDGEDVRLPGGPLEKWFFDSRTNELLFISR